MELENNNSAKLLTYSQFVLPDMNFKQIIGQLSQKLCAPLPAEEAHLRMSPLFRYLSNEPFPDRQLARLSAVLLLLYEKDGRVYTALMKRTEDSGRHSGQISFPGGGVELQDKDRQQTALRETEEEFGILQHKIQVLGSLSDLYIPVSNSLVTPIIGYLTEIPIFVPDVKEVARIIEVPLLHLINKNNIRRGYVTSTAGYRFEVPYYAVENEMVWGATAMIISEFLWILEN